MTDVIIDSIDSVLFGLDPSEYDVSCLSTRETCCTITDSSVMESVDASGVCEAALQVYLES